MDQDNRLTKTKEQWARAWRGGEEREVFYEGDDRLPPGQHLVENFPVLDLGFKPDIPLSEWNQSASNLRRDYQHSDSPSFETIRSQHAVQEFFLERC